MRVDELVLNIEGDDLHLRFHPELTVMSGLGLLERQSLAESLLGALAGADESARLRYLDGTGNPAVLVNKAGQPEARHDDGSPAAPPLGSAGLSAAAVRALVLVRANDLGVISRPAREDEPAELREARATLDQLTAELEAALGLQQEMADLTAELQQLDDDLATARDNAARREYAEVLAHLERMQAESAALKAGASGIDADRRLLERAPAAKALAKRWAEAARHLAALSERFDAARLPTADLPAASTIPEEGPEDLAHAIAAVGAAQADRDALDHRLQELAVATLPAPSEPLVAELGLIEQGALWAAAGRLTATAAEIDRIQVAHGGLGADQGGPEPAVIAEIERAHADVEHAERAAEATRVMGVAAAALGLAVAVAGTISIPLLIPVGMLGAAGAGTRLLIVPKRRLARAARAEAETLARADAPSYLSFHMRRVDAAVDHGVRDSMDVAVAEHRDALEAWTELVSPDVDVRHASTLAQEIRDYHEALQNLGGAADEIEQLRAELAERAEPALATALAELAATCAPYGLSDDHLQPTTAIESLIKQQLELGRTARHQIELEAAEADESDARSALDDLVGQLEVTGGDLRERVSKLKAAVGQAAEREESRARARPRAEVDAELRELEAAAQRLRRPEWDTVTAADASTPDIPELESRRTEVVARLAETKAEGDVEKLADRHAAIERRVAALEARHGGNDVNGDPGAVADIQQHLLARLTNASQAGPAGDPVPVVLDEAFLRVPADRKFDLLDLLLRLAERHQIIYLSDDAFVAAWARQQAATGAITLLEPAPA